MSHRIADLILQDNIAAWKMTSTLSSVLFSSVLAVSLSVGHIGDSISDSISRARSEVKQTQVSPTLPKRSDLKLSLGSMRELETFVLTTAGVIGVAVSAIDFKTNTFANTFVASTDTHLYEKLSSITNHSYPLLSTDVAMNDRVFTVLNGKMDCKPFADTKSFNNALGGYEKIQYSCAVSVPPVAHTSSDNFGGFLTVLLDSIPSTTEDVYALRGAINKVSFSIYKRDIL